MTENEAWSSDESTPEKKVLENEDIDEIDWEDFYYNETQLLRTRIFTHQSKTLKVALK